MRSIAIINQKGGVGKTTTAVHVAVALARTGRRVLLVDLDPQAHATLHVGFQLTPDEPSVYDVLVHAVPVAEVCRTVTDRFSILPAHIDLVGAELEFSERDDRERLLASALGAYRDAFDFCFIDCAPSLGLLTVNALAAADEAIIPLQPHFLPLQGLGRLLETVTLVRGALNPRLRVTGIALCMFETGTRLAQEVLDDVTEFIRLGQPGDPWYGARVFATKIRRNIRLAECPSFGQTVFDYAPTSHGAQDYLALAQEILHMAAGELPAAGTASEHQQPAPAPAEDQPAQPATPPVSKPVAEVAGAPDAAPLPELPTPTSSEVVSDREPTSRAAHAQGTELT